MSLPWRTVELREILRLDIEPVPVNPSETYQMVGVYSFGRGLFRRESISNGNTSYKYFCRLKADHVVMSQLFGWEGALALSSEDFAGMFVSPQFPTFLCDPGRLNRQFLGWAIRRPAFWQELGTRTKGMGDRRRTLNPEALLSCPVPLPPIEEQRRIVARIEQLAAKIQEALNMRREADADTDRLLVAIAHRADLDRNAKSAAGWQEVSLAEVLREAKDEVSVEPTASYPNLGIFSFGRGLFRKAPIDGMVTRAPRLKRVLAGQFIYSRLFAFEGAYGVVTREFDGYFVSNEYPTFECNRQRIRVEFLCAYFKAPSVWSEVASGSKGIGHRRQRVQPAQLLKHRLLLPPLSWQDRIALVMQKVRQIQSPVAQTAVELDALMPSILDKAFKGNL